MKARRRRIGYALASLLALLALAYLYDGWVLQRPEPRLEWVWSSVTYQLLSPRRLAVVLVAPWFLLVLGWSLADLPWQQRFGSLGLRVAFVLALAIGLARPVQRVESDKICTVYLVDVSESVSAPALEDAREMVVAALGHRREGDLLRVVTFARRPKLVLRVGQRAESPVDASAIRIERHLDPVSQPEGEARQAASGPGAGSNLQAALQHAYGLYPPGYLRRAVLISDGLQTDGDMLAEAERAAGHQVVLHTVGHEREMPGEVAIVALRSPPRVKVGQTFELVANIYASRAETVKARLKQGEVVNALDPMKEIELKAGPNEVKFKSVVRVAGEVTYALELSDMKADRFAANNRFATTLEVPGRPQVLYIEGSPRYAGPLSRALTAQQFEVDLRPAAGFPGSLKEIERFDFVIVSDVPKEALSLASQSLLEQYVRDLGGGFLFAGGDNGYGLGGWHRTTVARLLPVRMETEKRRENPSVAMALVIDRSGSMTGLPIEMAKKAARATLGVLASDDLIEVIAFDSRPHRYVKMQPARNRSRIRNLISRIEAGGGTEIFGALDAAYSDLSVTQARKKHVIVLTDGKAPDRGIRDLVTAMTAEAITVTTVGLGADVDEQLLRMIADEGGGRYHVAAEPQSLPRIFTKETQWAAREAAVEEWFPVVQVGRASFLKGIHVKGAPFLRGYVATSMKPTPARELLSNADTHEPVLARWRVGIGWALAWTSDVKARWAIDWIGWPGWERFWGQLVREHMRKKHRREMDMRAEIIDGQLVATIDAFTADDRFDNQLESELTVRGPEPAGPSKTIPMRQVAPGRYQARTLLEGYGSFLLKGKHSRRQPDGTIKLVATSSGHLSNAYPREYGRFQPDFATLERAAATTGGRFNAADLSQVFRPQGKKLLFYEDLWPWAVMAAVVAFLLDLLLRRVRIFDRRFASRLNETR